MEINEQTNMIQETEIEIDLFEEINSKLLMLVDKIDKLEKTYVSLNSNLIEQNIKMSQLIHGKLEEPQFENPTGDSDLNKVKELYYYNYNLLTIVYGPGTFDNKTELTKYGNWNNKNKTWDLVISNEVLLEKFPGIIFKEKEHNSLLINENN